MELERQLQVSEFDVEHLKQFNTPISPKEQILRHRHKHDENGSRTSDSSYSESEDGPKGSDDTTKAPIPLRPGYALRGIISEEIEGAVVKEGEQGIERTGVNDEQELKAEEESVVEALGEDDISNIFDVASGKEELSDFVKASEIAGIDGILSDGESLTIFAPTNKAFAKQPDEFLQTYLSGDWNKHLEDFLLSHVANSRVESGDLTNEMQVELLNEDVLLVTLDPPEIDDDINITSLDINGANGVIHEIDSVRLPLSSILNVVEFLELATMLDDIPYSFSSFLEYSTLTNLTDAFATASPITLFIPTDEAFENSNEGLLTYLGENINSLGKVLANHATAGNVYSDQLDGDIQTYEGNALAVGSGSKGIEIMSASDEIQANVISTDVIASNGVIHIIDSLLVPADILKTFNNKL